MSLWRFENEDVIGANHQFPSAVETAGTSNNGFLPGAVSTNPINAKQNAISKINELGINIEKPKHPQFAIRSLREGTFTTWPDYVIQTPRDMAEAGFFYTGKDDDVFCFYCGQGLNSWEPDDVPWEEHARWSPGCVFLQNVKGREFVEWVKYKQTHPETDYGTHQSDGHVERPQDRTDFLHDSPAVQSLELNGYKREDIEKAVTIWTTMKNRTDFSASDILQVIFELEEGNIRYEDYVSSSHPPLQATPQSSGSSDGKHALHPRHGFVWTDGKAIYLSPIRVVGRRLDQQQRHKLGEFENTVKSVHWSCDIGPSTCYMCVVLPQHVSIWKVDGSVPKLTFKQVRKLNVQPIPQGCLWNPSRDILCILSRQQCNFFFRHTHNRGSYAFPPLESGKISCGTWSEDGTKLILCVGAIILVYSWPEIDVSISNFTPAAWRIPQLDGTVRAVKSLSVDVLVCAAEIPLESLCKVQDSFSVSVSQDSSVATLDGSDESLMIVPKKKQPSIKDTLLNLPRNPESLIQDSCQLVTVLLREGRDPQKRSCVGVAGLLTPEVLAFDHVQKAVIVGSNTQNTLQVFRLDGGIKGQLVKATEVILEKNERPKGLACLQPSMASGQKGVLVATATKAPGDATFLPSSSGHQSRISLQFFSVNLPEVQVEQSNGKLNHSVDSGETSSLSSVDSPRHRIRVMNNSDMESDDQTSPRDLNSDPSVEKSQSDSGGKTDTDDSVKEESSQHATDNMEVVLTKQTTITQLCDQSDNDSEVSPREITLNTGNPCEEKAGIVDLEKGSGESSSDLETETVEFSEQTPKFATNEFNENLPEDLRSDHQKLLEEKHSSKSGSSVQSSPPSSSTGSRPASQETESIVSLVESTDGRSRISSQDVDKSGPLIQEIDSTTARSKDEDDLSTTSQKDRNNEKNQEEETEKLAVLEEQLALQNAQIAALQLKVSSLSKAVDETSVIFPTRYQSPDKPEMIQVVCRNKKSRTARKQFLLDNGRLQLEPVKRAFDLSTVELFLDGEPCVAGCNIDGYIPMRFTPSSTLIVTGIPNKRSADQVKHVDDTDSEEEHGIEEYDEVTLC